MTSIIEVKVFSSFQFENAMCAPFCSMVKLPVSSQRLRKFPQVCEIDSELKLLSHSNTLATMLLRQTGASLEGRKFTDFIAPGGGFLMELMDD